MATSIRASMHTEGVTAPPQGPDLPDLRRRSPLGDFLFGALYLRGNHPYDFADLGRTAGESGFDIPSVLEWLNAAEASGLVERLPRPAKPGQAGEPSQRAVRLTEKGLEVARKNPRLNGPG